MADADYDVWLGNSRGNIYSTKHTIHNPYSIFPSKRREYWSFSWHEIGFFDLPASIDYILGKTSQTKLQYIAHSQGTTAFFVMMSERPEYNDKVDIMHAIAPVAFLSHVVSPPIHTLMLILPLLKVRIELNAINCFECFDFFFHFLNIFRNWLQCLASSFYLQLLIFCRKFGR